MECIEQSMMSSNHVNLPVPLTWLQTVDKLNEVNLPYLPLSEVDTIAESCGVPRENLDSLLLFLHEMGFLMWNPEDDLKDLIIMDPIKFFVTPATNVICKHNPTQGDLTHHLTELHKLCRKENNSDWLAMTTRGIVSESLLRMLLSKADHIERIIALMLKFGLIVPITGTSDEQKTYLVPSLLPALPPSESYLVDEPWTHTGYFIFTIDKSLLSQPTLSPPILQSRGFLPKGLFERLVCKVAVWSQYTTSSTSSSVLLNQTKLYKNLVVTYFGNQILRIRTRSDLNSIEFSVSGSNPTAVHRRLMDLISKLTEECMKNLIYFTAIGFDVNLRSVCGVIDFTSDNHLLMIPLSHINEVASHADRPIILTKGMPLWPDEVIRLFTSWMMLHSAKNCYDLFLSYRWGKQDSSFVKAIFDSISYYDIDPPVNRAIDCFLDTNRLEDGKPFQVEFATALVNTLVIVPIISSNCLKNMKYDKHDPSKVDNVLVEWILSLQLYYGASSSSSSNASSHQRVVRIYPIMFGEVSENNLTVPGIGLISIGDLFSEGVVDALPDITPTATIKKVSELMDLLGVVSSKDVSSWTVRSVVKEMIGFLGLAAWTVDKSRSVIDCSTEKLVQLLRECLLQKKGDDNNDNNNNNNNNNNNKPSNYDSSAASFDIKDWLLKNELLEYHDQFIASGNVKIVHMLRIKNKVGEDLAVLKRILGEDEITMKSADARLFLDALNNLN
jgi:hypothetical protein